LQRFRLVAAWVVLAVWVISFAASVAVSAYNPPSELNALILIVVGAAFGIGARR
jgi:hypothetical protein